MLLMPAAINEKAIFYRKPKTQLLTATADKEVT
jgi:hypothetical protein